MTELQELVQIASEMDLNVYVLKYSAITDTLVSKGGISQLDRSSRLLDGLPEELQKKALGFCVKKKWRLSPQDTTGTEDPVFNELKDYVLQEAQMEQKRIVYNRERAVRDVSIDSASLMGSSAGLTATMTPAAASTIPSTPDPMVELTKQLSQLTLLLQNQVQPTGMTGNVPAAASSVPRSQSDRIPRCIYCDSTQHGRRGCTDLQEDIKTGRVRINENGRIANVVTGEEIPVMFGRGGMRKLVDMMQPRAPPPTPAPITANNRAITFDDSMFGRLGDNSTRVTTLDYERGVRIDEMVDADVEVKRRREDMERSRRVRSRLDDSVTPASGREQSMAPEIAVQDGPPIPPADSASEAPQPTASVAAGHKPKYRLGSELNQTINASDIGEKIMNASVQLTIRDILAVSNDVSNYLHEQTRKKRIPLEAAGAAEGSQPDPVNAATTNAEVNQTTVQPPKTFYALPSGQAKVILNDEVSVVGTLDDGSELNLIPERIYKRLSHPIDKNIDWRINGYDARRTEEIEELDSKNCVLGVLHDVLVDIGGVAVKAHVFVVKHCNADLILGRTWASSAHAQFTNEEDGSYTVSIKSLDGKRQVKFTAVPPDHERNREFVRDSLKA